MKAIIFLAMILATIISIVIADSVYLGKSRLNTESTEVVFVAGNLPGSFKVANGDSYYLDLASAEMQLRGDVTEERTITSSAKGRSVTHTSTTILKVVDNRITNTITIPDYFPSLTEVTVTLRLRAKVKHPGSGSRSFMFVYKSGDKQKYSAALANEIYEPMASKVSLDLDFKTRNNAGLTRPFTFSTSKLINDLPKGFTLTIGAPYFFHGAAEKCYINGVETSVKVNDYVSITVDRELPRDKAIKFTCDDLDIGAGVASAFDESHEFQVDSVARVMYRTVVHDGKIWGKFDSNNDDITTAALAVVACAIGAIVFGWYMHHINKQQQQLDTNNIQTYNTMA